MSTKKMVLGRGLSALIEDSTPQLPREVVQAVETTNEIDLTNIEVNPFQPRKAFDQEALQELSESIKHLGVVQPITVRKMDNGKFQLIAGERRFRAAKLAGLDKIPAFVRTADDQGMLELALVENIHRTDLNAIEVAMSFNRLVEECSLTQEVLSERVGKKRSTVANYLRLLKLPPEVQLSIREEKISMGHARALSGITDPDKLTKVFNEIIKSELSVRAVEDMVRKLNDPESEVSTEKAKRPEEIPTVYDGLREHLSKHFNTDVEFKHNNKGVGKIVISFKSDDELERILTMLDAKKG